MRLFYLFFELKVCAKIPFCPPECLKMRNDCEVCECDGKPFFGGAQPQITQEQKSQVALPAIQKQQQQPVENQQQVQTQVQPVQPVQQQQPIQKQVQSQIPAQRNIQPVQQGQNLDQIRPSQQEQLKIQQEQLNSQIETQRRSQQLIQPPRFVQQQQQPQFQIAPHKQIQHHSNNQFNSRFPQIQPQNNRNRMSARPLSFKPKSSNDTFIVHSCQVIIKII
jgi:hypothetical protein